MKNRLAAIAIYVITSSMIMAQDYTNGLFSRDQIDAQYKWDTRDIYKNQAEWENDFQSIFEDLIKLMKFRGKLSNSSGTLIECLELNDQINKKLGYLRLYAKLNHDVEMQNESYQRHWSRYSELLTKVSIAQSFINTEITEIPGEQIDKFINEKSGLKVYSHFFESLYQKKDHIFSNDREAEFANISKLVDNTYNVFGSLVYSELPFPVIKDDSGNNIQLNRSTSWRARSSQDKNYRKRGYEQYYLSLKAYEATLTENLNSFIEGKYLLAKSRGYNSCLEASFGRYDIPVEVYSTLIESININLQPLHRWMSIKKRLLKLDTLRIYDSRVSAFSGIEKEYSWEEARDLTLKSLKPFGSEYLKYISDAYENKWIDVYPNIGKETGGYSSGPSGPHPYVKMNWGGKLLDFYTLVHEFGHYVHGYKILEEQALIYNDYPPLMGEIASTTAENISQFHLINSSESKEEKLYHIEQYLDNAILNVYNTTMMAEFELAMYTTVENGKSLSQGDLHELYGELFSKYYGKEVIITDIDKYSWLEWPHYYLDYYLFSYATSFSASIDISSDILNEGKPALDRFMKFLATGTSEYPIESIKMAGADLTTSNPYNSVAKRMNSLMDELERLIDED